MVRPNQVVIDDGTGEFICDACNGREFVSEHSILQHCRSNAHRGEWCERCQYLFVSSDARAAHVRDSLKHWMCHVCKRDETSRDGLVSHYASKHSYCYTCQETFQNYLDHRVEMHNRCRECGDEFDGRNNLIMHQQVHLPRNKECYGCYRTFGSHSAIMIHLESGTCASNVTDTNIDHWAFNCYQSRHYTNDWDADYRYRCPTCETNFKNVSGLFQHVESPACVQGYDGSIWKLRRYLIVQVPEGGSNYSSSTY